jgi:hypothetical protein
MEQVMNHTMRLRTSRLCLAFALTAGMTGVALAARGGGDSGDSSMNPYTGDSYRYFYGHNLGEQGTIRPGGTPPATGYQLYPPRAAAPDESAAQRAQDERAQRPLDLSHKSARWPTSEEHP